MADVRFGPFVLHPDRRQLLRDGAEVHLTPKAFDLLTLLVDRAPSVVTKADIHAHLWPDTFVADSTLVGLVKELRRALGAGAEDYLRTVHRVGYAFAGSPAHHADARPVTAHWIQIGPRRVPLQRGVNLIGRDPNAAVWLDVPGVSRRHAQIVLQNGTATLEDLGSKNGTLLADRPLRDTAVLRNADRVQIATEVIVYRESRQGISTATQRVRPQKLHRKAT
jgi:DNA-binding winged helix-turn-helix (wHTH) protein